MNQFVRFSVCCWVLFLSLAGNLAAQRAPEMAVEELRTWRRIAGQQISNDGKWAAAKIAPWEGDNTVVLFNQSGREEAAYSPVGTYRFSYSSQYLVANLTPAKALTDSLKLAKTKKDDMPMNTLLIRRLAGGQEWIDSVRSYKLADEVDWLAYQRSRKDSTLIVRTLDGKSVASYPSVSDYRFAPKSAMLWFITSGDTLGLKAGLYALDPVSGDPTLIHDGKEYYKHITWSEQGDRLAYLYTEKKDSAYKSMALWLWESQTGACMVARSGDQAFPKGWVISEHGELAFAENGRRVFFGTSPEPRRRDTTRLAADWPDVQVWSWDELVQYTVQNHNKSQELNRTYRAVYDLTTGRSLQLADPDLPLFTPADRGNGDFGLLVATRPYSLPSMWEYGTRRDTWSVSLVTGERKLLKRADFARFLLSPSGKYAFWYDAPARKWFTIELATGVEYQLTTPETFAAWDEDNDMPTDPAPHGAAGWTSDDEYMLIYDRYDIWRFDPTAKEAPVNLTRNGRTEKIAYRLLRLDPEERSFDLNKPHYLSGFNEMTKGYGYYEANWRKNTPPKVLVGGDFKVDNLVKAKHSDAVLYTRETYEEFPELRLSDLTFKKSVQLTHLGEQQQGIRWGTSELISWISLDGKKLEGLLFKPADFDPNRKYPLIVNFYERNSETLHHYRTPSPHRSTIDYRLFNSNEYLIFNPDIVYTDGYPGESCYNCVMPGITKLIETGYIDQAAIGAQGHSWGGYQVAYLATRTDLFAAIESGAPVVNMFSAYGGIRWGTGLARSFQYEHTQSRIGGTPWSHFREFVENSPLFTMDKVNTPILIMHNDNDGHVPWYQGIEYFVALKRLGKPAWLLNYPGEIHWPEKIANRMDFQKRMFQFFDHYLKGSPMPRWMSEGLPAIDQEFELGYETAE